MVMAKERALFHTRNKLEVDFFIEDWHSLTINAAATGVFMTI